MKTVAAHQFGGSSSPSANQSNRLMSVVRDAPRFPIQPLDPATRAFVEARFGHNFRLGSLDLIPRLHHLLKVFAETELTQWLTEHGQSPQLAGGNLLPPIPRSATQFNAVIGSTHLGLQISGSIFGIWRHRS